MRNFFKWINEALDPVDTNLKDGAMEDVLKALENPSVRRRYIESLITEIWEMNVRLDRLMEEEQDKEWKKISMRRNSIVFCLNQILTVQDQLESELAEQDRQNRILSSYQGAAATLDNRR